MFGITELADFYSAIDESARLLEVPCARDRVWHILTTYADALDADTVIAFRVATGARHAGELDFRFTVRKSVDPYALALSSGLATETSHPVGTLLADLQGGCPVDSYAVDFGVVGGFKKIGLFFPPDDLQRVSGLTGIASMPRSLSDNVSFFTQHGLDQKASLVGIDYQHKTVNVYLGQLPAQCLQPATIRSMLREVELPAPSGAMLELGRQAFGIYATLGWDSPKIERLTFAVMTADPTAIAARPDPKIELFVSAPCAAVNGRFVYAVSAAADGEYYKLQSYYQWRSEMADLMLLSDSGKNLA